MKNQDKILNNIKIKVNWAKIQKNVQIRYMP